MWEVLSLQVCVLLSPAVSILNSGGQEGRSDRAFPIWLIKIFARYNPKEQFHKNRGSKNWGTRGRFWGLKENAPRTFLGRMGSRLSW